MGRWFAIAARYIFRLRRKHRLPYADNLIVDALERFGVHVTDIDTLSVSGTEAMISAAKKLLSKVDVNRTGGDDKEYMSVVATSDIDKVPEIPLWGLDERLLNIAEQYFGKQVSYRGLLLRRDSVTPTEGGTRHWHLDFEDERILKIFTYLEDVDIHSGPFEYISKDKSPSRDSLVFTNGRVLDNDMSKKSPESAWTACTGKSGAVIFADIASVWHRGKIPDAVGRERLVAVFAYNSSTPSSPAYCGPINDWHTLSKSGQWTAYQRAAVGLT